MPYVKKFKVSAPAAVQYVTADNSSHLFDVLVRGELIRGSWDSGREKVQFYVPAELAPSFEQHYYFKSGQVIRDPQYVPPINDDAPADVDLVDPPVFTNADPE